jgi:heat shock protein beta
MIAVTTVNFAEETDEEAFEEPMDDGEDDVVDVEDEEDNTDSDGLTPEQRAELEAGSEQHDFGADVSRIMDIIINSLYTNKEVFLRELVSNASDALDKVRYKVLKDPSYVEDFKNMEIKITFDKDAKTLTILDTGIGMSKNEMVKNLGTVARSGTTQFLELIGKTQDMNLIGQFGVGFYSAFLVANKVTVISKTNKEPDQHIWISSADGKFVVNKDPRGNTLKRGTKIILHLKEDAIEYVEQDKIKELVKKYSQFINYPIYLWVSKDVTKQVAEEDYNDEENAYEELSDEELENMDEVDVHDYKSESDKQAEEKVAKKAEDAENTEKDGEDVEVKEETELDEDEDAEEPEPEKKQRTITETVWDWELINDAKAIWLRPKGEIENDEYNSFYKSISKDNEDPLTYTHFTAEGDIEFKSILFIPNHAPYDMFENYYGASGQMKLYVRKVMISEEFEDLMPRYLNFISGVVHSDDLPLNVSRE